VATKTTNKQPQLGYVKWIAKTSTTTKNKTTSTGMREMGSKKHQQQQLQQKTTSTGICQMDGKNIDNNSNNNNGAS
jgi:hypothetical protein